MNVRTKRGSNKPGHKLNKSIRHPEVRVVSFGDRDGVYKTSEAIEIAESEGFDLIEITPNASPPVCRIMEYSKFKYDQKKREKDNNKNSKNGQVKEIKFGPNTGEHDFNFKLNHAKNFLEKGNKVKAFVQFRGREAAFKEKGELMLLKFAEALTDLGKIDELPKMTGRKMFMTISPRANK